LEWFETEHVWAFPNSGVRLRTKQTTTGATVVVDRVNSWLWEAMSDYEEANDDDGEDDSDDEDVEDGGQDAYEDGNEAGVFVLFVRGFCASLSWFELESTKLNAK
jgi:hypothetical protein